ncbi:MAG TPA: cohesin domain-containing protein [Candidatus Kapabacteria bacterium]|nr:cohesin domain-containing protein [Candidatus Kapabacteria bacterium]
MNSLFMKNRFVKNRIVKRTATLKNNESRKKSALKQAIVCALLTGSLLGAGSASALTVEMVPATGSIALGGSLQIDVRVSDLTDLAAPSLGAYDLNVLFDAAALQYSHVSWGNQLDLEQLGSLTLEDSGNAGNGLLNLAEISYDTIGTLNDLQAGNITLFSLFFTAVALGNTQVGLDVLALSDAGGSALTADAVSGAQVAVVPVPAALPLLASGLLLLLGRMRRRG